MIFKDERVLWCSEVEELSKSLAGKNQHEIIKILDAVNVVCIRSTERPVVNMFGRLLLPFVFAACTVLACIKWLVSGSFYLDSTVKKYKLLDKIMKYVGLSE